MRYLYWLGGLVLFLLVLGFAVKNSTPVTVSYYLGYYWQGPLILVILIAFFAGAVLGMAAGLSFLLRQRREILGLKRELRHRVPRSDEVAPVAD